MSQSTQSVMHRKLNSLGMHTVNKREKMLRLKSREQTDSNDAKIMLSALPEKKGIQLKMVGGLLKMRSIDMKFFTEGKK